MIEPKDMLINIVGKELAVKWVEMTKLIYNQSKEVPNEESIRN